MERGWLLVALFKNAIAASIEHYQAFLTVLAVECFMGAQRGTIGTCLIT
jgi:hypothetical protein